MRNLPPFRRSFFHQVFLARMSPTAPHSNCAFICLPHSEQVIAGLETCPQPLRTSLRGLCGAALSFNCPEKRNDLGDIVTPALREMPMVLKADADVRVLKLTGVGKAFCAGGDVEDMGSSPPDNQSIDDKIRALQHRQQTLTLRLHEMPKPTIAALPGAAAGAGMSIALACDLRIGSEHAFFAPGFGAIGLSGDYGGSWQLTQLVWPAKAKEFYFTGRRVHADEAWALGLLNEVLPETAFHERMAELAAQIANGPPLALRCIKQNINRATQADFKTCLDWEADRLVCAAQTDEHKEAVQAIIEKRQPTFRGK